VVVLVQVNIPSSPPSSFHACPSTADTGATTSAGMDQFAMAADQFTDFLGEYIKFSQADFALLGLNMLGCAFVYYFMRLMRVPDHSWQEQIDSARHVIKRIMNPRFLNQMDSARHVIKRIMNPRFLNQMASYDVASTILSIYSARHVIKRLVNPRFLN